MKALKHSQIEVGKKLGATGNFNKGRLHYERKHLCSHRKKSNTKSNTKSIYWHTIVQDTVNSRFLFGKMMLFHWFSDRQLLGLVQDKPILWQIQCFSPILGIHSFLSFQILINHTSPPHLCFLFPVLNKPNPFNFHPETLFCELWIILLLLFGIPSRESILHF